MVYKHRVSGIDEVTEYLKQVSGWGYQVPKQIIMAFVHSRYLAQNKHIIVTVPENHSMGNAHITWVVFSLTKRAKTISTPEVGMRLTRRAVKVE